MNLFSSPPQKGCLVADRALTPIKTELSSTGIRYASNSQTNEELPHNSNSDERGSISNFSYESSHGHNINGQSDSSGGETVPTSPTPRKVRVRTIEVKSPMKHVASSQRVLRNTDSMLEDVFIADRLKRRLVSRREFQSQKTISCTALSDFIMKSIMEGSLDAISAVMPTDESLSNAASLAFHACMAGYFGTIKDINLSHKVKLMFMESLERVEFRQGEFICKQNEQVEKLFVIEEGIVEFSCNGQVAGNAGMGSILGELSLVYGIPAPADVKCVTPCVILWYMDALSFRRIQAVLAKESLKASTLEDLEKMRDNQIHKVRRTCSSFLDLQEQGKQSVVSKIQLNQLKKIAIVGQGTFGSVYVVEDQESDSDERLYSLKRMSKSSIMQRDNQKRVLIEKHALQASSASPFVITLLGTFQDKNFIYLLTDFVPGGNLMRYMIKKDTLTHEECVFFSANIVSGLVYLHNKGFAHRDIKPENCLIGKDGYLKLCDLGMAKRLPSTVQLPSGGTEVVTLAFTICGTPEFMAPEFVLSTGYSKCVDWWALGCLLVEMYTGRSPFEFDGDLKKTFKSVCLIGMGRERYSPPKELCAPGLEDAHDFSKRLLSRASERIGRCNSRRVAEHPYFAGMDFKMLMAKKLKAPYVPVISHEADSPQFDDDAGPDNAMDHFSGSNECFVDF